MTRYTKPVIGTTAGVVGDRVVLTAPCGYVFVSPSRKASEIATRLHAKKCARCAENTTTNTLSSETIKTTK
jgi:hypothetical protein